jgi:hypothetical protein
MTESDYWEERNPGRRPGYEESILGDNEKEEVDDRELPIGYIKYGIFGG